VGFEDIKNEAFVTVGLVTYNRAHLLERAVASVLRQTFGNFTLIISDDNSKDNTEEIARMYEKKDPRVRYIKRVGIGMTENFLRTLADAKSKYFMWLCDDDSIENNFLESCIAFLENHKDYVMACGTTRFMVKGDVVDRHEHLYLESDNARARIISYYRDVNSNIVLYGLMRRHHVKDLRYPDTFGADLLWSSQVVFAGKTKILDDTFFYYSLEGISQQTTNLKEYYKATKKTNKNPYEILRAQAFNLIHNKNSVFSVLPYFTRLRLACSIWFILRERFCMPALEAKIRLTLRLRTRIKRLFQ